MNRLVISILASLIFSIFSPFAFCQPVFIQGRLTDYNQSSVPFFKHDLKQGKDLFIRPLKYISDSFSFSFRNPRPQLFSLLLNPVFIEPSDTINFNFSFVTRPDGSFYDSVFAVGKYPGNYMYYNRFRRWNDKQPDLRSNDSASVVDYYNSLRSYYFDTITHRRRLFETRYPVSRNFSNFLQSELPFTFLKTLLTAYKYSLVKIPSSLKMQIQKDIDNSRLNDSTLLDSESYNSFLNLYGAYFLNNHENDSVYTFGRFKKNIDKVNSAFRGKNREFAVANTTQMFSLSRASYYDSAVDNYINDLTKTITDSVIQKNLVEFLNMRSNVNLAAFNSIQLKSVNGDTLLMKDALNNNHLITLIDFWASWCGPCHEQDPFLADFHKQRKDMQYIAISIDEDFAAWLKSVNKNENKFVRHYAILNPDESRKLTALIGLHAIPRYILMDKQNRLAYMHASMPKNKTQLLNEVRLVEQLSQTDHENRMAPPAPPPPGTP